MKSRETIIVPPEGNHDQESLKSEDVPSDDPYQVLLEQGDDPKNMALARKWIAVIVIALGSMCVTCSSSVAAFTEGAMADEFGVPIEVTVLGLSLFVLGLGMGPLLVSVHY